MLLVATPLHNDLESVEVVRHRVIVAATIATAFAIVLGYVLATLFARRIRRLEVAAERIADGRFDEPVVDAAPDELGQLARAFERMRLRLASLDRARAEFIANASHELRTPLFSLAGFLELLGTDEEIDAATRDEFLDEMRVQVDRLTKLATDLLDLSRMDAGRLTVADESLDLGVVGDAARRPSSGRASRCRSTRSSSMPAEPGVRLAATRRGCCRSGGSSSTTRSCTRRPEPRSASRVEAEGSPRDAVGRPTTGPGSRSDDRQAVFERFYRLGGTVASGSGLGLAIARELAELMGGRVELESRPGLDALHARAPERGGRSAPALASA